MSTSNTLHQRERERAVKIKIAPVSGEIHGSLSFSLSISLTHTLTLSPSLAACVCVCVCSKLKYGDPAAHYFPFPFPPSFRNSLPLSLLSLSQLNPVTPPQALARSHSGPFWPSLTDKNLSERRYGSEPDGTGVSNYV